MDFPSFLTNRIAPRTVVTSKLARTAYGKMKSAYDATVQELDLHNQRKDALRASVPPKVDPLAQASQSKMSFEELLKANPAAAYHRANGTAPSPQQLQDFTSRFSPQENGLNQRDIDVLKELIQ